MGTLYRGAQCRRRLKLCALACLALWILIFYTILSNGQYWKDSNLKEMTKTPYQIEVAEQERHHIVKCDPHKKLVLVRTHTNEGDILAKILQRFGYHENLSFLMSRDKDLISNDELFHRTMIKDLKLAPPLGRLTGTRTYDVLASHVRFNYQEINFSVPNATYITVLTKPTTHLPYVFNLYQADQSLHLKRYKNPLEKFMEKPQAQIDKRFKYWFQFHNGQMYNLGLDHDFHEEARIVTEKINHLHTELDFVMLAEYFDESLVILRKKLCWLWQDILYFPQSRKQTDHRSFLTSTVEDDIMKWNWADTVLYNHFNETLWREISNYGPTFQGDLQYFRQMKETCWKDCLVKDIYGSFTLKNNALPYCNLIAYTEDKLWEMIRHRQLHQSE
ncbi:galactosylceramide sulfotransferase-like [Glandiceps talaboti]